MMEADFHCLMSSAEANRLEVAELSEFVEDRLYFMVLSHHKDSTTLRSLKDWKSSIKDDNVLYLNVDHSLVYDGFFDDFGPLNLAMIYRYIGIVRERLKNYKRVVHYAYKHDHKKRANAAFLICAYMVIEENWTAKHAYEILSQQYKHQYMPFRDASYMLFSEYSVTVEECINALYKAKWYGFFNFGDFDVDEYEKYETVKFGDINWIVPSTFLAFSSPHSRDYIDRSGYQMHSPAYYYQYFNENNVKHVVRLNSKRMYDAKRTFVEVANIQHTDMVFPDGTPPTDTILNYFLNICEQYIEENTEVECTNSIVNGSNAFISNVEASGKTKSYKCGGAVAVHCKAGLGRTGCLIASYIVKHWPFTAVEAIAWIRICRPGSVIGAQQKWLMEKEEHLKTLGKQWRERKNQTDKYKRFKTGVYSVIRHTFKTNSYEYIDPPPQSSFSYQGQFSSSNSDGGEIKRVQLKESNQKRLSSVLKKKLKTNNHASPDEQSNDHVPNLRQKRSATKSEDPRFKFISTQKSYRKMSNRQTVTNNPIINSTSSPKIARNNSKTSVVSKKNTKAITLNKTSTKLTKMSTTTETIPKTISESNPSYTRATVASSARTSRRLRSQNSTNQ